MSERLKTPLYEEHTALNAKMIDFGKWIMPVEYAGIINEHNATRTSAGIFDLTHMGELKVEGTGRIDFVNKLVTNDVESLQENQILYTAVCKGDGGILDDILVYRLKDYIFLVVNASNVDKIYNWFKKHETQDASVTDISDDNCLIAIQGPVSERIMQKIVDKKLSEIKYYHCDFMNVCGHYCLVSRTGYTGEDGFEIYCKPKFGKEIWKKLLEQGKEFNIQPIGLGARDTLRLESKYCLYGNEINEELNPIEAGIGWTVKMNKKDFTGKSALEKLVKTKTLIGFEMTDRGIPRHGYKIQKNAKVIGFVTSGTYSPTLKKNIGLGYVDIENKNTGNEIDIIIREKPAKAVIVKTPFYIGSIKH